MFTLGAIDKKDALQMKRIILMFGDVLVEVEEISRDGKGLQARDR